MADAMQQAFLIRNEHRTYNQQNSAVPQAESVTVLYRTPDVKSGHMLRKVIIRIGKFSCLVCKYEQQTILFVLSKKNVK